MTSRDRSKSQDGGEGATNNNNVRMALQRTVDDAIDLIRREVQLQREKSNSMCRLKTAHNWEEVKKGQEQDNLANQSDGQTTDGYFMRAHTITVLIFLIGCLVYVALFEPVEAANADADTDFNSKRGLLAALYFWLALGMTIMPDGPFSRPHPIIWRLMFAMSIVYELLLIFLLFQSPGEARRLLKHLDPSLGEPIPEKDYGGNCRIYDHENPADPYHNLKDKMDIFIFAHAAGYWCKTLIFRDWWLTTVISVTFEFMEYTLEHQLPNFSECWWDHWILDVLICNGGGTVLGLLTLRYLSMKTYNWRGLFNIPTYRGKIKRIFAQFSPSGWIEFTWNPLSSLERWLAVAGIILLFLLTELNTFYLKFVLWVPPENPLNFARLGFILFWGAVGLRECFQLLDDPECDRLGRQSWVLLAIIATEFLVCIKFGWSTVTKPLPRTIAMWWVLGLALFIIYTVIKFVIFKPTKLKPAKASGSQSKPKPESIHLQKEPCCAYCGMPPSDNDKKSN